MSAAVLLAVDDRSDNLFVLEQVVETYLPEIKMLAAESAEAGLALAATEVIDGALIDVQMPGMNGIEMCRRLKADPRTALIHVILVTAHRATPELKAQGLEAGADDFIAKPIDNVELAAKLGVMLRLRAAEEALRRERDHLEEAVRERTQELRDAEYRYRTLFHTASDPIFISDLDGRLLEVNEEAGRLLGYTRDELLRLTVSDLITPKYAAKRPELLKQLQATDHLLFETELVTRDRRIIPAETSSRLMDLQGRPAVLSITRDITERKAAEEAQALNTVRIQALLDLHLLVEAPQAQILDFILDAVIRTMQSEYAFIGLMDETESIMTIHRYSKPAMKQCAMTNKPILYPISDAGLWGECVRQKKAIMVNDYQAPHPSKKGLPEGHVPIQRLLAVPVSDGGRVVAAAAVANKRTDYTEDDVSAFTSLINKMWEIMRSQRLDGALKQSLARTTEVQNGTIEALATLSEVRDPYTAGHQRRVTRLACALARELGLPDDRVAGLRVVGLLHDTGKISVPAEILSKPGKLSDTEFAIIKSHAQAGYEIVKEIRFPWPVAEVILQHHERLDGSGYPQGLQGDDILPDAKILAVADVVEAMASHRPYRPALGIELALEEIAQQKGVLYDPKVVDACIKLFTEKGFQFDEKL
jgi:PAS domain S-box-containing protein/putative nucleotidyltransferase with HDIG domain